MRLGVDDERTGIEVRLRTVAQRLRDSYGFCPVSITTTPSWVRMIPLFDSKPLPM
jgi:hypothetical protein